MTSTQCPCGLQIDYSECCQPLHTQKAKAKTAEQLMRSRYSAFVKGEVDYLYQTLAPESRKDYDAKATKEWSTSVKWKGLKIVKAEGGTSTDKEGTVEFVATYEKDKQGLDHHEVSQFRKDENGVWYFVDGDGHTHAEGEDHNHAPQQTIVREGPKIGRNDPCSCGSGKKYKKCCGS